MFGEERMKVWTYLRRFLFADDRMNTKVGELSGGERSRLLLAKVMKNGVFSHIRRTDERS